MDWILERADAFPKAVWGTVTHRLVNISRDVMEEIVEAIYTKERAAGTTIWASALPAHRCNNGPDPVRLRMDPGVSFVSRCPCPAPADTGRIMQSRRGW